MWWEKVKIIVDDKIIFEGELEDVNLNMSRKVTPVYSVGLIVPCEMSPSAITIVSLTGKYIKIPKNHSYTMEQ